MKIIIETIPHSEQRYPTCGDWWWDKKRNLQIRVSNMDDWRYVMLVAVHELWEVILCEHHKVRQEDVDEFDRGYEEERKEGDDSEPGDHPFAPYRNEHCSATGVERILAAELGVVWKDYEDELSQL